MTRPFSAPLLLLLGTITCWTFGRVVIMAWDARIAAGAVLPVPTLAPPGLPSAILLPPLTMAPTPVSTAMPDRPSSFRPIASLPRPHAAQGMARPELLAPTGGANDQFTAAQSALLRAMLMPGRLDRARRSHALAMTRFGDRQWAAMGALMPPAAAPVRYDMSRQSRWMAAAWILYRSGDASSLLARQGRLGASQAGLRIGYLIDPARMAEMFGRLTTSPAGRGSADAAFGLSVRPAPGIPASLVIERRQRLSGADARSAFAAYATGGGEAMLPAGLSIDGYGAAGLVGLNRPDLFAEGAVRTTRHIARAGPVRFSAGGGIWGAAQPGASRLDAGPTLTTRFPAAAGIAPRIAVDYRLRVAGHSEPGSGIALTLSADF